MQMHHQPGAHPSPHTPQPHSPLCLCCASSVSVTAAAIPVGGRTQRLPRLHRLLSDLIAEGAGRSNIYVFEDDGSRDGPSPALAAIARQWGVHLLQSHVQRKEPEPAELFGLHLARHYHYMMDTLLLPDDPAVLSSLSSASETPNHFGYAFMVIIEDDLLIAPDAVHFFSAMSRVMDEDSSLLCVCAHADNAFYASTRSEAELLMLHHHHHARGEHDTADGAAAAGGGGGGGGEGGEGERQAEQHRTATTSKAKAERAMVVSVEEGDVLVPGLDGLGAFAHAGDDDEDAHREEEGGGGGGGGGGEGKSASSTPAERWLESKLVTLSASEFDFRRGQHFMAPGWMTSARVYSAIRPSWFDAQLNLPYKERLNMPNGNWDAFLDSQAFHLGLECIYPEIPRVAHVGANGYTVSAAMQAELFDNLRLSSLPSTIDYGDLSRLSLHHYDQHLLHFIQQCTTIRSLDAMQLYRRSSLCLLVPSISDKDGVWVELFSNYLGQVSIGGHANYGKQRGIHHGSVFTRWITNLVLVIGAHGKMAAPFLHLHGSMQDRAVQALAEEERRVVNAAGEGAAALGGVLSTLPLSRLSPLYVGCFQDDRSARVLPQQLSSVSPVTPLRCLQACALRGFELAGIEWGWECWCGNAQGGVEAWKEGKKGERRQDGECDSLCVASWDEKQRQSRKKEQKQQPDPIAPEGVGCGGDFLVSVYSTPLASAGGEDRGWALTGFAAASGLNFSRLTRQPKAVTLLPSPLADVQLITAAAGQSCTDACQATEPPLLCDDALLALIHDDCARLQSWLGCASCVGPSSPWEGFAAPGQERGVNGSSPHAPCMTSRGKYLRCSAVAPSPTFVRACTCATAGTAG